MKDKKCPHCGLSKDKQQEKNIIDFIDFVNMEIRQLAKSKKKILKPLSERDRVIQIRYYEKLIYYLEHMKNLADSLC